MKKEIKSYEELLKCDGMKFEAEYEGKKLSGIVCCRSNYIKLRYDLENDWESYVLMGKDYCEVYFPVFNIIVEDTEEWIPKLGECVFVGDCEDDFKSKMIGYFLFEKNGLFHVVLKLHIGTFHSLGTSTGYMVYKYKFIKKYEQPKIELNIDEARKIIAENKGVNPENVTIKGL